MGKGSRDVLLVRDERTGLEREVPISNGTVDAAELRQFRHDGDDGLIVYDSGLRNTAVCKSAITAVDGRAGTLHHRGYSIEDLAAHSSYLEVAYTIFHGELPSVAEFDAWAAEIAENYLVHQNLTRFLDGFRHDAHPMGVLISTVAALSTFFPDATQVHDADNRRRQTIRLLGQVPTLAAFAHRRRLGRPLSYPSIELSYTGNFLSMMFQTTELRYQPDPVLERALDILFILHADHEQACSTTTMRCVGSAQSDPFTASAAAAAGLRGRFHDEAYEAVLHMLDGIGGPGGVDRYLERVKTEGIEPPGFGHRVYRTYDPRARIIRNETEKVFEVTGRPEGFETALELEEKAARDDYFIERGLYPIVDYYEAVIYRAIGFPPELFPVLFAIPRFIGWLSQWDEMMRDRHNRTIRPRQVYVGAAPRAFVPRDSRRSSTTG